MQTVLNIIRWIVLLPVSWMPDSWQGLRRSIIAGTVAILTALQAADLVDIGAKVCAVIAAIVHTWNESYVCDITPFLTGFVIWIPLVLEALKSDTERSIFKLKRSKAKVKKAA